MSKTAKWTVGVIGALLIGMLGSMLATAVFDWRLPAWLHRLPDEQPTPLVTDWLKVGYLIAGITGVIVIVGLVLASKREYQPRVTDYVKDRFFGMIWRWRYGSDRIREIACFCSACDRQLRFTQIE